MTVYIIYCEHCYTFTKTRVYFNKHTHTHTHTQSGHMYGFLSGQLIFWECLKQNDTLLACCHWVDSIAIVMLCFPTHAVSAVFRHACWRCGGLQAGLSVCSILRRLDCSSRWTWTPAVTPLISLANNDSEENDDDKYNNTTRDCCYKNSHRRFGAVLGCQCSNCKTSQKQWSIASRFS